jgi:hypothetical protein
MKAGALHILPWLMAVTIVPGLACDPQVGTGYTGEAMFSVHGDVILADSDARDLVPALAFLNQNNQYVLITGEVRGQFPSGFRMDVTTPPPPSTFIPFAPPGTYPRSSLKGEVALGFITVVPRQYPNLVPALGASFSDGQGPTTAQPWVGQFDQCALSGVGGCVHLSLACTPASCPLVVESPISPAVAAACGPACVDAEQDNAMLMRPTCTADQDCRASFYACKIPGPTEGGLLAADSTLLTCSVLEEHVDQSLRQAGYLEYAVPAVRVYYLTEQNDFPAIGTFGPGYVLEKGIEPATKEAWASILACEISAAISAGCAQSDVPCLFKAFENAGCPWTQHYRFLPSPISDPLTLTMARRDRTGASNQTAQRPAQVLP